jgi:hypothetical protein
MLTEHRLRKQVLAPLYLDDLPQRKQALPQHFSAPVMFGGQLTTRAAMIAELQRIAATWADDPEQQRKLVDRYLQGQAR